MSLVECTHVSKCFRRHTGTRLIREHVVSFFSRSSKVEQFYALKDLTFTMERGTSVALVGHNGAGKSTLLALLAGVARPDAGTLTVDGRVAALLELGSGFHPDLTGEENVRLNAALLGFSRSRVREIFDSIVDFSGIADFIAEPLRTYSSGMMLRLAFSVAIHAEPDILLVDEVLAVGDQAFQNKCYDRIKQMREAGVTLVCVSHSTAMLQEFCDEGLWLDHGELVMKGSIAEVLEAYSGGLKLPR